MNMHAPPIAMTVPAPPRRIATPSSDFSKRIRRAFLAFEQNLVPTIFGPRVTSWTAGIKHMADIIVDEDRSGPQVVRRITPLLKALSVGSPCHRTTLGRIGSRTFDARIDLVYADVHPMQTIEEPTIQMVCLNLAMGRRLTVVVPEYRVALSMHALERLFERTTRRWQMEDVAAMVFRLGDDTEKLLGGSPARYYASELFIPIPGTDALATGIVRRTADATCSQLNYWMEVRTVLERRFTSGEQRDQASAISALLAGIEGGVGEDEIIRLRMAVKPLEPRTQDYVTKTIHARRAAKRAEHKGA